MKEGATDRGQNVSPLSKSHNVAASELDVLNPRLDCKDSPQLYSLIFVF